MGDLYIILNLFIYSIILYEYGYCRYLLCTLDYNLIVFYFVAQIVPV